jgi:GNAT superfamily N-acetyltransferase
MDVEIESFGSADPFLARAHDFLVAHEAENNLTFGIAGSVRANPHTYGSGDPLFAVASVGGRIVGTVLRTPPFDLVFSLIEDERAVDAFAAHVAAVDPAAPGVNAARPVAMALATAIGERTGGRLPIVNVEERIYRLTEVVPPPPAPGRLRVAGEGDRGLLARWLYDFGVEALPHQDPPDADLLADRWLRPGRTMYVWEDAGVPVSITGIGGTTPNGFRVGPVYTPPELRGRGYASNLVARSTQLELDRGRAFAFLLTDLSNPTSNAIYQRIGYEPVSDILVIGLRPARSAASG